MGYTTAPYSVFASDMRQTPKTVEMVLDFAGWTPMEAASATGIYKSCLVDACNGVEMLRDADWQKLLDVCGRRAFDHDEESA